MRSLPLDLKLTGSNNSQLRKAFIEIATEIQEKAWNDLSFVKLSFHAVIDSDIFLDTPGFDNTNKSSFDILQGLGRLSTA